MGLLLTLLSREQAQLCLFHPLLYLIKQMHMRFWYISIVVFIICNLVGTYLLSNCRVSATFFLLLSKTRYNSI